MLALVEAVLQVSPEDSDPLSFALLELFLEVVSLFGRAQLLLLINTIGFGFLPFYDFIEITHGRVRVVSERPVEMLVLLHFFARLGGGPHRLRNRNLQRILTLPDGFDHERVSPGSRAFVVGKTNHFVLNFIEIGLHGAPLLLKSCLVELGRNRRLTFAK